MIRSAEMINRDIIGIERLIDIGVSKGQLLPRSEEEIMDLINQKRIFIEDHPTGILGCASLDVYSKRLAEVRSVYIMPSFRRTKLGALLVERCIEEARGLGIQEVLAITKQTKFFESSGFRKQLDGQFPLFLKLK